MQATSYLESILVRSDEPLSPASTSEDAAEPTEQCPAEPPAMGAGTASTVFVPTRPGHRQWLPAGISHCSLVPAEGVRGLFGGGSTHPAAASVTPTSLAGDIAAAAGSGTRGCIVITDLSALCHTLGGETPPLSLLQVLRRQVPHCTLLLGMNTSCLGQRSQDAVMALSTLYCECASPLVPLPESLRGPGTHGGRLCLGEVQSTDRSLQTGKATQALHPFVVSPATGRLDYAAGLAATGSVGSGAQGAGASADELEMRSVIAGSSMSLTRTQEEEAARKAVQLSYQHKGGLAAVKGGGAGAGSAAAAPVSRNLITLDIGDVDSDSDSESEEEV